MDSRGQAKTMHPPPTSRAADRPLVLVALFAWLLAWTVYAFIRYAGILRGAPLPFPYWAQALASADAATIGLQALRILAVGAIAFLGARFGRLLLAPFAGPSDDAGFRSVAGAGLGLGALAFLVAGLLLAREATRTGLGVLLIAFAVVPLLASRRPRSRELEATGGAPPACERGLLIWIVPALAALAVHLSLALTPPVEVDELVYHLSAAKQYAAAGAFVEIPALFHAYLPFQTEMLFTLALGLADDVVAKLLQSFFWALTAVAIYRMARTAASRHAAIASALAFISMPLVIKCGAAAYVDVSFTLYALGAVWAAAALPDRADARRFYLATLLAGMAIATKWFGVNVLAIVVAFELWSWLAAGRARPAAELGRLAAGGLLAALPVAPYLVRNLAWTGNPFYPFGDGIFHVGAFAPGGWDSFKILQASWLCPTWSDFIFPWLGPVVLFVLPLAVLGALADRHARRWALAAVVYAVLAAIQIPADRFFLPAFALLAAAAAVGVSALASRPARVAVLAWFFAAASANACLTGFTHADRLPVALNRHFSEEFLGRYVDHYPALKWINEHYRPGEKYFLLGSASYYYVDAPYIPGYTHMARVINYRDIRSADDFAARLGQLGVTHLLVTGRYKKAEEFDARIRKALGLPDDARTFDRDYLDAVRSLLASDRVTLAQSFDKLGFILKLAPGGAPAP